MTGRSREHRLVTAVGLAGVLLGASAAGAAAPRPRVLVLDVGARPVPAGVVEVLRIQLGEKADVEERRVAAEPMEVGLAAEIESARRALSDEGGVLAVWISTRADGEGGRVATVFAVGPHPGRAIVEIAHLPEAPDAEWERSLALKVASLVDALLAARDDDAVAAAAAIGLRSAEPAPAPVAPATAPASTSPSTGADRAAEPPAAVAIGLYIAGGVRGALDPAPVGPRASFHLRAGPSIRTARWRFEAGVDAAFPSRASADSSAGEVGLKEVDLGAHVRASRSFERFALGLEAGAGLRLIDATGTAPDGRSGRAHRTVPAVGLLAAGSHALTPSVVLHAGVGLEISCIRQRFAIQGETLVDLGRLRPLVHAGIAVYLP